MVYFSDYNKYYWLQAGISLERLLERCLFAVQKVFLEVAECIRGLADFSAFPPAAEIKR